ncbi:MAG: hypothetical protein D6758_13150 [Gammaproteobacteria bacterium]|nr:MAG: hypothetical protein D6758_13150 [Gammaproteobacteria bacterium]
MTEQSGGTRRQRVWQVLSDRVNDLSARERGILLATGLVVLVVVLGQFWWAPAWQAWSQSLKESQAIKAEVSQLNSELELLDRQLSVDPDETVRQQIQALEAQLASEKKRLEKALSGLVSPTDMVPVLQRVLGQADNLSLQALEKLPVKPVTLDDAQPEASSAVLFEHAVSMTLRGRYFEVLNYLKALEAEAGVLVLRSMNYQVKGYPMAEVTLTFSTLSLDPAWLAL